MAKDPSPSTDPNHVLVLRPGALGDTLLAVPALRGLRRRFPTARLTLAANASAARLLAAVGEVDVGMSFDRPEIGRLLQGHPTDLLKRENHAVVAWMADPHGEVREVLTRSGATMVTVAESRPTDVFQHCADFLVASLALWGVRSVVEAPKLHLPATRQHTIAVHPGSGSEKKNWPAVRFAEVIEALQRLGWMVRMIVGEADDAIAVEVDAHLQQPVTRWQDLELAELASSLSSCGGYLGNDSGVSHLAGLLGIRAVVLFGITDPAVWSPLGPDVRVLPFTATNEEVVRLLVGATE